MSKTSENTLSVLFLFPVTEIKSRSGLGLYPDSGSQRGVKPAAAEAATTTTAAAAAATVSGQSACCQRSAQGSGGCGRACAHQLLLRNKDRLMRRWTPQEQRPVQSSGTCQPTMLVVGCKLSTFTQVEPLYTSTLHIVFFTTSYFSD